MSTTRRDFIHTSIAAGGALSLGLLGCSDGEVRPARNPLRILILGGTGFIGPHQVEYAMKRGHTVTLFNRGQTRPHLFPEVEKLRGDRNDDLESLKGREWDAVIDNPAMVPEWVRSAGEVLKDSVQQYLFISTLSVFANENVIGQDESGVLCVFNEETGEAETGSAYGGRKVLCERAAEEIFPGRTTVVRPGLITGTMDPTTRVPYWPIRIDRGGEVLVPGEYEDPVQWIDAQDLGEFVIHLCEQSTAGIFNTCSRPFPMGQMLDDMNDGLESEATFTWVDEEFLNEQGVLRYLTGIGSIYIRNEDYAGYNQYNVEKAIEAGLTFRPVGETARDIVGWYNSIPEDERPRGRTLSPEQEAEVLAAWHARG